MLYIRHLVAMLLVLGALAGAAKAAGAAPMSISIQPPSVRLDRSRSAPAVPNIFQSARNLVLQPDDIDHFIDPRVIGQDRLIAHRLMLGMPPNLRGDFLYLQSNGRLVTNNLALLPYAMVSAGSSRPDSTAQRKPANYGGAPSRVAPLAARPFDYSSPCSPQNPPQTPGGAYIRLVSQCGFASGWGFIQVPAGNSRFASGDNGELYFEIWSGNNAVEGGLQYNSDSSIQPYLRCTCVSTRNGYIALNNSNATFFAGEILGLFHGITQTFSGGVVGGGGNGPMLAYTIIGALSNTQDPQTAYITSQAVQLVNPAWLFYSAAYDMTGGGIDPAGAITPCARCSVSEVTAIAQNGAGGGYRVDGSYFGRDQNGYNTIHWLQVAFGNWTSACAPGVSVCPMAISADPFVYSGGAQYYPNNLIAGDNEQPTGYGPYETYDGIDLTGGIYSQSIRKTLGTFTEPLPPMPCAADRLGNCAVLQAQVANRVCYIRDRNTRVQLYTYRYSIYSVARPPHFRETATYTQNAVNRACTVTGTWAPNRPSTQYGDPNLLY